MPPAARSPLDLAALHLECMYDLDERGRIAAARSSEAPPPPRFVLVRTREGNRWLLRHDVPDDVAADLERLAAAEPPLDASRESPLAREQYREVLAAAGPVAREYSGPAFVLPSALPLPAGVTRLTRDNGALLEPHLADWLDWFETLEQHEPLFVAEEDGAAVAICGSARRPSRAIEAGVATAEPYRSRGHATRVVQAWAHTLASDGVVPLYSTTWDNTASRAIAARLGGMLYGADFWLA